MCTLSLVRLTRHTVDFRDRFLTKGTFPVDRLRHPKCRRARLPCMFWMTSFRRCTPHLRICWARIEEVIWLAQMLMAGRCLGLSRDCHGDLVMLVQGL